MGLEVRVFLACEVGVGIVEKPAVSIIVGVDLVRLFSQLSKPRVDFVHSPAEAHSQSSHQTPHIIIKIIDSASRQHLTDRLEK